MSGDQLEQRMSSFERRMIGLTKGGVLVAVITGTIFFGFTNTGKTPAKKLTIVSNFAVARNGEKVDFRYSAEAASPPERNSRGLLTAGGDTHINFDTTRGRPASAYCIFTD